MRSGLTIGIARTDDSLVVATTRKGAAVRQATFPEGAFGEQAIRIFIRDCAEPFCLAVRGSELGLVVDWVDGRDQESIVVSAALATDAASLASFAARGT